MEIIVPCKLGEAFQTYKFKDWIDGNRVYRKAAVEEFVWVEKFVCNTHCLSIPKIFTSTDWYEFDEELGFYGFDPKYIMEIPDYMFEDSNLLDKGMQSKRVGHISSLHMLNGQVIADFVCKPNYEHIRLEYPFELIYHPIEQRKREKYICFGGNLFDMNGWLYT